MWLTGLIALFTLAVVNVQLCQCRMWECSLPAKLQDCYERVSDVNVNEFVGGLYNWMCEQHSMLNDSKINRPATVHPTAFKYISILTREAFGKEAYEKRQTRRCVRKEYRMLTRDERRTFHNALNVMKNDRTVSPNKYDSIAGIHTGTNNARAHGGPAFLSWHRLFLRLFETALRQINSTICLPYWDSTLDTTTRERSIMWTPEFMGTRQGPVVEGPCAGWSIPGSGALIRAVGADGDPMTAEAVNDILSRNSYNEIVAPTNPRYSIENQHGAAHVFVGGSMNRLNTAAYDPVFWLHHCFIDYLFQRFRVRLRSRGVDPSVYPTVATTTPHQANVSSGFENYPQSEGYSNTMEAFAEYQPVPTCSTQSPSCGGGVLVCQRSRCVSPLPTTSARRKRSIPYPDDDNDDDEETCQKSAPSDIPIQNDYCVDGTCDTKEWAFLPLKIVSVRPPKFYRYKSYPVRRGRVDKKIDIYSPKAYNETRKFIANRTGEPKTYIKCQKDSSFGHIFVSSQGLNYAGKYMEYVISDQRMSVSVSTGFVGIKRPTREEKVTKALIRAHDSCGRLCRIACRDPSTGMFQECSGCIALTNEKPLHYGNDFNDAVMNIFDYRSNSNFPNFLSENILLTVFCDYGNTFPYSRRSRLGMKFGVNVLNLLS